MGKIVAIPDWAAPALQGLAYWLGSQHASGIAANISEGAIAWELMRQVHTHRSPLRTLEAEVFYRHIPEFIAGGVAEDARHRADLVIATSTRADRGVSYGVGQVEAVIEVKHSRSRKTLVWEDIDYMADRRVNSPSVRAFLIYATIDSRPEEFTQDDGSAIAPRNQVTPAGSRFRVRRVCRATQLIPSKNKNARGHYAVLIEVDPPKGRTTNDA